MSKIKANFLSREKNSALLSFFFIDLTYLYIYFTLISMLILFIICVNILFNNCFGNGFYIKKDRVTILFKC